MPTPTGANNALMLTMLNGKMAPTLNWKLANLSTCSMDIAITDACSGIQQFEAMILVAFWFVMVWKRPFFWRCVHYAFLIPSIIVANAIRIVLTIVLYKAGFESVLNNTWHEGLGYMQVVLTVALFFLVGCLLPEDDDNLPGGKNDSGKSEGKKGTEKGSKKHG